MVTPISSVVMQIDDWEYTGYWSRRPMNSVGEACSQGSHFPEKDLIVRLCGRMTCFHDLRLPTLFPYLHLTTDLCTACHQLDHV